jgi:hypothetical protein
MINRKKKLRFLQLTLLVIGMFIVLITYSNYGIKKNVYAPQVKKNIGEISSNSNEKTDVFFNIEYSGLDLSGNRYIIKSEEASINKDNEELVKMVNVDANFYLKDGTILNVKSQNGIYNNKTLDMIFENEIKAKYEASKLFAEKAEYSNSKSYLTITDSVKVIDPKGTIFADKLLFDIKNQTLDIASFNDDKINANLNLNEKRF